LITKLLFYNILHTKKAVEILFKQPTTWYCGNVSKQLKKMKFLCWYNFFLGNWILRRLTRN